MSGRISVPARVVLVDKPAGCTSFDVVRRVKRGLSDKVGHAGTLDPFATGLLLVLVGQATRISSLLMDLPKEYAVRVQFGATSSTGDPDGVIEETDGSVGAAEVVAALDRFRGVITQSVPMTSAVRVGGERLYKKAHRGEEVETPSREVVVYDLTMVDFDVETQRADLIAQVSKGTYVRRLAQDLGEALGVGAYASSLRRTRVGTLSVDDAIPPDGFEPDRLMRLDPSCRSISAALQHLPSVTLAGPEASLAANGGPVRGGPVGRFLVCSQAGLLGVWEGSAGRSPPHRRLPHASGIGMRLYRSIEEIAPLGDTHRAVAIGTFDGVHLGHQAIIGRAVAAAAEMGGVATVLTFEPHPSLVLAPESAPLILTPLEPKLHLLQAQGVQEVIAVPFDRSFAAAHSRGFLQVVALGASGCSTGDGGRELPLRPRRCGRPGRSARVRQGAWLRGRRGQAAGA